MANDMATHFVSTWVINDGEYHGEALGLARAGDHDGLCERLTEIMHNAERGTAAWHVLNDLLSLVDWRQVASDLVTE